MDPETIQIFYFLFGGAALLGLLSWIFNKAMSRLSKNEKDINEIRALYVSQRQFDRYQDQMRDEFKQIDTKLEALLQMMIKVQNHNPCSGCKNFKDD